ncbi:MAG: three-Cys-motif partner protein TcmP, partial [Burkholderiales bacterium]
MSTKRKSIPWEAPPHTLAKISILRAYLSSWYTILGQSKRNRALWYIDGFAGPGEYTNSPNGSPLAALASAKTSLESLGNRWVANEVNCVFIEQDKQVFDHLKNTVGITSNHSKINKHFYNLSFIDGLRELRKQPSNPFLQQCPVFAFIDPFGAKGIPFEEIKNLLAQETSEVLINFDSDGIGRIFLAGKDANHEKILNEIFGDESWKLELAKYTISHELYRGVLNLYKQKLRALPN